MKRSILSFAIALNLSFAATAVAEAPFKLPHDVVLAISERCVASAASAICEARMSDAYLAGFFAAKSQDLERSGEVRPACNLDTERAFQSELTCKSESNIKDKRLSDCLAQADALVFVKDMQFALSEQLGECQRIVQGLNY